MLHDKNITFGTKIHLEIQHSFAMTNETSRKTLHMSCFSTKTQLQNTLKNMQKNIVQFFFPCKEEIGKKRITS